MLPKFPQIGVSDNYKAATVLFQPSTFAFTNRGNPLNLPPPMKRPLGIVAVLYAGGLVLGNFLQPPLPCLFAMALAIAAGALLLLRLRPFLLWPLLFFTGWTNFVFHTAIISPTDLRLALTNEPELVSIRGTITSTPLKKIYITGTNQTFTTTARLNVAAIQRESRDWQPAFGQIEAVGGDLPEDFFRGREVQIYGVIGPPPKPIAEGLFNFRAYLRRQEIYFRLKSPRTNDWRIVGAQNLSPPLSERFSRWARAALTLGLPPDDPSAHLEQAMTLGDKTYLTDDTTEPFVRAATYHIFAVDGLRMAILFGIFFAALRALRVPRSICGAVLIPLIWFYVMLTGWPASAIRAAVMLTIVVCGWALRRPVDGLNSLFAAALIILLWQPQQLFQAGFQLSFVVVFCILLMMPALDKFAQRFLQLDPLVPDELRPRWQRLLRRPSLFCAGLVLSSLAAWLGSMPLVAYYFHVLTPISVPANFIAVLLCILVLAFNILSLLFAGWLPAAAIFLNHIAWHLMQWIQGTSIWFAALPHAYAYVATPTLFTIALYYLLFLVVRDRLLKTQRWRKTKFTALILLTAIWCGQWWHDRTATRLTILPLDGGSAVYCDAPGGENDVLVDCGNENSFAFTLKPYLEAQGVNSLPRLALTHGDERQIAAFTKLQSLFSINKVVTSPAHFRSPAYRQIIELLNSTPGLQQIVNCGDQFSNWTVLHPSAANHFTRADDSALVLRAEFRGTRILLLSDLGRAGQDALLDRNADLRADIVVAGLPDQNEPLAEALLDAIHPRLIILSDSEFPASRRASRALCERLRKRGIPVLCTSELGAVKISFRQNECTAETVDGLQWSKNSPAEKLADNPSRNGG